MQREIKFRAWDKKRKLIIEQALYFGDIGLGEGSVIADQDTQTDNPLIWMQFTGLHDKNGKDVFEGDIVKWNHGASDNDNGVGRVIFERGMFRIEKSYPLECFTSPGYGDAEITKPFEVIGNIYENSNLIK